VADHSMPSSRAAVEPGSAAERSSRDRRPRAPRGEPPRSDHGGGGTGSPNGSLVSGSWMGHGWVPLRLSCWWLAVVFAVSHFSGGASANGFISGPERRCPINEVAACHRPLHVRLLGARFHPDGTRSMRQPAGSAVRAGQSSRPTVRSRRAKKRPSRRTTSQRERRSPASRRGSSTSPGPRSHVLPPAHRCRRGLPRPIGAQLRGLRAVGLEDQGLQRLSVHRRVPANGM